jgi:hypothetical protein
LFNDSRVYSITKTVIFFVLLCSASYLWYSDQQRSNVRIAVTKGKRLYDMAYMADTSVSEAMLPDLREIDLVMGDFLAGKEYAFVSAVPLGFGEARQWRDLGCEQDDCAHVILYDYTDGGTANAILKLDGLEVIDRWFDSDARPGGSASVLPKAMAIAGADPTVRAILGDIGDPDPAMIPMSGWLADDDCREDWCVDLTYHDPAGSGRILHIFVNLQKDRVARVFYSRGRPDRSLGKPLPQRNAYQNGCHDQYGWEVCWEMTAHDGINFRDAAYDNRTVFSSAKISQVEAWYPSWPGGYRDEIGFAASVPPFGGTDIVDLSNGFEVRQLFTEFTHWPNCICCYRYEEIIRFFADGTMEFEFVSHGPGCDDIPLYRPFWRIDLDLDDPTGDEVWVWQESQWKEAREEVELHPFVDDLSPDGQKLATFDGDLSYRWRMLLSDPLGRDESRFFILQKNEQEGDGPIITGPGDTFLPPRQWVSGDAVSGEDVVLWFVPTLEQIMGEPWWCMPDPDPEFSPCNVILRAEPAGELRQPTAEELAELEATATPAATAVATLSPDVTPTETTTPAPSPTPQPLQGEDIETILTGSGCGSCHSIGEHGERRKVGPDLSNISSVAGKRIEGVSAEEYLRQSVIDPNAFIAEQCPNGACLANIMPADYGTRLSAEQVEMLVGFLMEQGTDPSQPAIIGQDSTVDLPTPLPKAFPAPKRVSERPVDSDTGFTVQILLLLIVFLLTVARLIKRPSEEDT